VDLERGPLSLVSPTEELLGRKSSGSGLENREYGRRDPLCWPRNILYPKKVGINFATSGGRSAGIVCSRTKTADFVVLFVLYYYQTTYTLLVCTLLNGVPKQTSDCFWYIISLYFRRGL
jgi:hypothetical protein